MPSDRFFVELKDKVAHVRLARPKRFNAIDAESFEELQRIVRELDADARARVIVLSAAGRHFCAGLDLGMLADLASVGEGGADSSLRVDAPRRIRSLQAAFDALEESRLPVLAAVQGACVGAGLDLIAACDLRFATREAFFCIQEINVGMAADLGTLQRLPHLIPQGVLRELAYTGRRLTAERAREIGLVNAVYDDSEMLMTAVEETAREIAARSPLAVWGSKETIRHARDHPVRESLDYVALWQAAMFRPEEVEESLRARRSRRQPRYPDLPPLPRRD